MTNIGSIQSNTLPSNSDVSHEDKKSIKEITLAHDTIFSVEHISLHGENPQAAHEKITAIFENLSGESQELIKNGMLEMLKKVNFATLTLCSREQISNSLFRIIQWYPFDYLSEIVNQKNEVPQNRRKNCLFRIMKCFRYFSFKNEFKKKELDKEWFESWKTCNDLNEIKDEHVVRIKRELFTILGAMNENQLAQVCEDLVPEIFTKNPYCDLEFQSEDGDKKAYVVFSDGIIRVLKKLKPFIKVELPE